MFSFAQGKRVCPNYHYQFSTLCDCASVMPDTKNELRGRIVTDICEKNLSKAISFYGQESAVKESGINESAEKIMVEAAGVEPASENVTG